MRNTKEKILNTARDLFNTYGYSKTSMDLIAKEAGVTKKTIYSYFKDKETLINYFLAEQINIIRNIINKIYSEDKPLLERINQMILATFEYRDNNKFIVNLGKSARLWGGKSKDLLMKLNKQIENEIYLKLKEAAEEGLIKECDLRLTAFIIYKIYVSVLFEWEGDINREKATKEIMEFLKSGLIK